MITLKCDNRSLLTNAKYSFLTTNYLSGQSSVVVTNSIGFAADDYILFGNFGSESSEIVKVSTVTSATHTLNLASNTISAHSESTKVTILKYNQVRFYHTTTTTYSATDPVTGYIDIQAKSNFTYAYDSTNTTGYGWFVFYNSTTLKVTTNSNAIPYAGFGENSVKNILDSFFSLLNSKDKKLITNEDAFSWLNEAYAIARNELNLVNVEYSVSSETSISIVSGTKEYALATDFSELISVYDGTNDVDIEAVSLPELPEWDSYSGNTTKYYLRGSYIGFSPTPASATTYTYRYQTKTTALSSYYDNIDLPTNNFYFIKDYMLARAAPKLSRGDSLYYMSLFNEGLKRMKMTAVKREAHNDSWSVADEASV